MRECLWLIKNGIPYDVAFGLSDERRTAWAIVFSEFEGGKFDWLNWQWKETQS